MQVVDRLQSALDGANDPEVCSFQLFQIGGKPQHPTAALLQAEESGVRLTALMRSAHPHNSADADNQNTWERGDVLELFLQEIGRHDYYELHSTPEGMRLQLHFPDCVTFRDKPLECVCDAGLRVANRIDPVRELWQCEMFVPYAGFLSEKGRAFRFGLGRYDYGDAPNAPEISCWPFMKGTFHSPQSWREMSIDG